MLLTTYLPSIVIGEKDFRLSLLPHLEEVFIHPISALAKLRQENRTTQAYKYTKASSANVISGIRQWIYFTLYFMIPVLPASVDSLVCFLELMARTSSFSHLKHLLHSVKFLHQSLDLSFPDNSFQLDVTMQGLKRRLARVPFQVLPITPKVLRDIYQHLNIRKNEDLALWCSFLVAFYALLRKKNVVPEKGTWDPKKVICRRHISVNVADNRAFLYIGFSKTNQFGNRDLVIPIPGNNDPVLDPVRHLNELFSRVSVHSDAPAFSYSDKGHVSYTSFTQRLKNLLVKAGYDADEYSGHSFRRGGATFLHACGGTALQVQACGDWTSSCFTRYLFLTTQQRWSSQLLMAMRINATAP